MGLNKQRGNMCPGKDARQGTNYLSRAKRSKAQLRLA